MVLIKMLSLRGVVDELFHLATTPQHLNLAQDTPRKRLSLLQSAIEYDVLSVYPSKIAIDSFVVVECVATSSGYRCVASSPFLHLCQLSQSHPPLGN